MKTLQIIKDEYAKSKGFIDYYNMIDRIIDTYGISSAVDRLEEITDDLLTLVQQEQQKIISENAKMRGIDFDCDCGQTHTDWNIDKSSIINDKSIIR